MNMNVSRMLWIGTALLTARKPNMRSLSRNGDSEVFCSGMRTAKMGTLALMLICMCLGPLACASSSGNGARCRPTRAMPLESAVALGLKTLVKQGVEVITGDYRVEIKRFAGYWALRFIHLPEGPGQEIQVDVYDTHRVEVSYGM